MVGRNKVVIDWKRVDQLALAQCNGTVIADALGVHYDTLIKKCLAEKKTNLSDYLRQKRIKGKSIAKEKFFEKAFIHGNVPAMIFWAKNNLGWKDNPQINEGVDKPKDYDPKTLKFQVVISEPDVNNDSTG